MTFRKSTAAKISGSTIMQSWLGKHCDKCGQVTELSLPYRLIMGFCIISGMFVAYFIFRWTVDSLGLGPFFNRPYIDDYPP